MLKDMKILHVAPSEINDIDTFKVGLSAAQFTENEHFFCLDWFNENELLDGKYTHLRAYFDSVIPSLRVDIESLLAQANPLVHVYLGSELTALYAAYYTLVSGARLAVTIVNPQFMGGKSPWAQAHPLLLNRLITTVISNAFEVQIRGKEHFEKLPKAFPKIEREYVLADLPEPDTESDQALSSPSNDTQRG